MPAAVVVLVLGGLVLASTALGLAWRATTGRVRRTRPETVAIDGVTLGSRATLLQFSTEVCAPVPGDRARAGRPRGADG